MDSSDIAMCKDIKCPSRVLCHRYTCEPNPYYQSYGLFGRKHGQIRCDEFWNNADSVLVGKRPVSKTATVVNKCRGNGHKTIPEQMQKRIKRLKTVTKLQIHTRKGTL